jgi:hypothetical protein
VNNGRVCATERHHNLGIPPNAMHIHAGAKGVAGPIVVDLTPILGGQRCVDVADGSLLQDISDNPASYYVNIHNAAYPNGAVRGQLETSQVTSSFNLRNGITHPFGRLTGLQEVTGPGDPDATGAVLFDLKASSGQVCVDERYANIDAPFAMHIHAGAKNIAGPIVVDLTSTLSPGTRCVSADPDLIRNIRDHYQAYYCNIHNVPFPAGALRGQLQPSQ